MKRQHCKLQFTICNFFFLFCFHSILGGPCTARAEESEGPLFDLHAADGRTMTGPLKQVSDDWSMALGGKSPNAVEGKDVITLRRSKTALPPFPQEEHVILANGDRIPGTLLSVTGERLRMQAQVGNRQELELPLTAVTLLWFAAPDGTGDAAALLRRLTVERRRRDVLMLRNGDSLDGTFSALDDKQARFDRLGGKSAQVERNRLAVIALNSTLTRAPVPRGPYGRLVLANGCRLSLASAQKNGQSLVGKTTVGATVRVPIDQIAALDIRQGRAVYLSDLKPYRYEHTPFLGVRWPYRQDSSVAGNDLRLAGSTYEKGIGMHSESRLTYDLGGSYQWFEAVVGLDDHTGRQGSVVIEVLVDNKPQEVGGGKELTGQDKPRAIRVPVADARRLTLVVKFGRGGDVQDHVDWADARLIR